jgi:hypothetical protein
LGVDTFRPRLGGILELDPAEKDRRGVMQTEDQRHALKPCKLAEAEIMAKYGRK